MNDDPQVKKAAYEHPTNFTDLLQETDNTNNAKKHQVFASAACERIFGYAPTEMIGRVMIEMVHSEDRARTQKMASQVMAGLPMTHFEIRYVHKDGQIVHIMWSARWSEADQLRIAVAHDITERKHVESMQAARYAISEAAHATEDFPALLQKIHQIIGELLPATNF